MAEYVVAENIPLSRTVSATFNLIRRASEYLNPITQIWCEDTNTYHDIEDPLIEGAGCIGTISIATARGTELASIGYSWDITQSGAQNENPDCPEDYTETPSTADITAKLELYQSISKWTSTGPDTLSDSDLNVQQWQFSSHHASLFHQYEDDGLPDSVSLNRTVTLAITASGTFSLVAEYPLALAADGVTGFKRWIQDHDPYGEESSRLEYRYVPTGEITISITGAVSNHQFTIDSDDFASQAEFEAFLANGFGPLMVNATIQDNYAMKALFELGSPVRVLTASLSGSGLTGGSGGGTVSLTSESPAVEYAWNGTTGALTVDSDGAWSSPAMNPQVIWYCGPYTARYIGTIEDLDGQGRTGTIELEPHNDTYVTGAGPSFDESISRAGHYYCQIADYVGLKQTVNDLHIVREYDELDPIPCMVGLSTYHAAHDAVTELGGLIGLSALGEPTFPEDGETALSWYNDARVDLGASESYFNWTDALTLEAPMSKTLWAGGAAGWSVVSGEATLSTDDGALLVTVTAGPCSITRTSTETAAGGRYVELDYESDDTDYIGVELGGRQYRCRQANTWIDLLAPLDVAATSDETQSTIGLVPTWGWGVHDLVDINITGLRVGTYLIRSLILRRKPKVDGGSFVVVVTPGGFIGSEVGDCIAGTDIYSKPSGNPRKAWVFVDGVPCEMQWGLALSNAGLIYPEGGLVAATPADTTGWKVNTLPNIWLVPGVYTATSEDPEVEPTEIVIPARITACEIDYPMCSLASTKTAYADKILRGLIAVRAVQTPVQTKRHVTISGTGGTGAAFDTDDLGFKLSPSLQQPLHEVDREYQISANIDATSLSELVETRNRNVTMVAVRGFLELAGDDSDLLFDQLTGIGCAAWIDTGVLYVARTFDYGLTWGVPTAVANSGASRPCLVIAPTNLRVWGVLWNEDSTVKLAWSTDGFATKEVAELMTGVTHVRALVHPLTGVMLVAGWRDSDDSIVVARSFDHGVTLSVPIAVAAATEKAFGLAIAPTQLNTWCITCTSGGSVQTYWSTDNGLTWSLAS